MNHEDYGTIWVCQDCMLHHANGECGSCHDDHGHDEEPWSAVDFSDGYQVFMGLSADEHECAAETRAIPDECDCETNTYSTSQCGGCGSYLHGERHAFHLWKEEPKPRPTYPAPLPPVSETLRDLYMAILPNRRELVAPEPEHEYATVIDGLAVTVDKVGGGTLGRAYEGDWTVSVANGPVFELDNEIVHTGSKLTHEQVADLAVEFANERD